MAALKAGSKAGKKVEQKVAGLVGMTGGWRVVYWAAGMGQSKAVPLVGQMVRQMAAYSASQRAELLVAQRAWMKAV